MRDKKIVVNALDQCLMRDTQHHEIRDLL